MNLPDAIPPETKVIMEEITSAIRSGGAATVEESRAAWTEITARIIKLETERDAFRNAFCNGPAYDTGETPEQARERWDKEAFIEGVSAVLIARQAIKERDAEREKVAKLRKFANHSTSCTKSMAFWEPCDCGVDEVMEETK